eukprot:CAMPEP_0177450352 /NCGR_PEP_ID=MMETSP0369-20130122/9197_1 /TAXON_ID=447022 ORGANISM="Scrippsiella hangoei-like, Strain SHHI-4" /NCGR_SAMPLE_ID=MMETSP0369 /ASSEMBLY_ACC=CAM_ASM_000364 /LENGTH=246 /DNA_ID=CAMNT_0018922889 /DNA_START=1 /DNA_END=740 /DNA_ORIENTATION=-
MMIRRTSAGCLDGTDAWSVCMPAAPIGGGGGLACEFSGAPGKRFAGSTAPLAVFAAAPLPLALLASGHLSCISQVPLPAAVLAAVLAEPLKTPGMLGPGREQTAAGTAAGADRRDLGGPQDAVQKDPVPPGEAPPTGLAVDEQADPLDFLSTPTPSAAVSAQAGFCPPPPASLCEAGFMMRAWSAWYSSFVPNSMLLSMLDEDSPEEELEVVSNLPFTPQTIGPATPGDDSLDPVDLLDIRTAHPR